MQGMNVRTGRRVSGVEHLRQSIINILSTPLGTRIYRREYGSRLFALLDQPMNQAWQVEIYAAVAEALNRWEPRLALQQVEVHKQQDGRVLIDVTGEYLLDGQSITIDGLQVG